MQLLKSPYVLNAALRDPAIANLEMLKSKEDAKEWLRSHLDISRPVKSNIIRVALTSKHPREAIQVVDVVVNSYLKEVQEVGRDQRAELLQGLREKQRLYTSELKERLNRINDLELGITDSELSELLRRIQQSRIETRLEHVAHLERRLLDAQIEEVKSTVSAPAESGAKTETLSSAVSTRVVKLIESKLETHKAALESEIQKLSQMISLTRDLDGRYEAIKSLEAKTKQISLEISRLEIGAKSPGRISLIQPAIIPDPN
jgi:hypothetical protein